MDNNKNYIRRIGSDIHSMSFIIGAGFSKNISDKYLSWGELLKDMIHEMYAKEMRTGYMNEWEIIDKYGYLGIASEYIRRKGYHEAIDVYYFPLIHISSTHFLCIHLMNHILQEFSP